MQKSNSTPCKNCIHAAWKDNITQTGCRLGLLDKYKKYGIEILEAFDENKEFFVLKDKKCYYKYNKPYSKWTDYDWKILRQNTTLSYSAMLDISNNDIDFLKSQLHTILLLQPIPREIIVISPFTRRPHPTMVRKCLECIINHKCRWRVSHPYTSNYEQTVDALVRHFVKTAFYLQISKYSEQLNRFLQIVNNHILYSNMPIGLAVDKLTNATLFNTRMHKIFNGNVQKKLTAKLEEKCPETIFHL